MYSRDQVSQLAFPLECCWVHIKSRAFMATGQLLLRLALLLLQGIHVHQVNRACMWPPLTCWRMSFTRRLSQYM
jgi:hypothetical protein